MQTKEYIPWVEKYRPVNFDNIVLDNINKSIFNNILKTKYMPNLLLYGPPGTGKTTTIINLINQFQKDNNQLNKELMIHLNASDERGVDIIRNQINSFVKSKELFNKGTKFIILDEVDYMTKNAQLALKYLLEEYQENTRFCLICNYISKIDESLQSEFVKIRFNKLPKNNVLNFLTIINNNEGLNYDNTQLEYIINNFNSDIRSMINYMQSNQSEKNKINVINNNVYKKITELIKKETFNKFNIELQILSKRYNLDIRTLVKLYINFLIKNNLELITQNFITIIETILHNSETNEEYLLNYIYYVFIKVIT
tara:strand:+ start:960 stop:1895 length:936 start_codon:yes stop_codon:yes gene_type:complete